MKSRLSPQVPSRLQNVIRISNVQVISLFGRLHFKKREIQRTCGFSGAWCMLVYISRGRGLGLPASIQISVWMWPLCSEVRRVYVCACKINGLRTASKDVRCCVLSSQHPPKGNAYPQTFRTFLYPSSCSDCSQSPRQQGHTSARFFQNCQGGETKVPLAYAYLKLIRSS